MSKPLILNHYEFDHNKHEKYLTNRRETLKLKCNYCTKDISASVEITSNWVTHLKTKHVFSVGGAILRPSRRRLSDRLFEMLMFLKCNWYLFKNEIQI